jgi:outer membrane protein assembly factor BamB
MLDMLVEEDPAKPEELTIGLRLGDKVPPDAKLEVFLDGAKVEDADLAWQRNDDGAVKGVRVSTAKITTPGRRLLAIRATAGEMTDQRVAWVDLRRPTAEVLLTLPIPGGIKAGVVRSGDMIIVAGTDGDVRAFDAADGSLRWQFRTRGEILATPLVTEDTCIFGSGDGHIYAVDLAGKVRWIFQTGLPCYAPIVRDGDVVYAADNGGRVHALTLAEGRRKWLFERADYSIEAAPIIWKDKLSFGAWDGHLYALNREDGTQAWKSFGPESSKGRASRYFSPADCPPVAIGDRLFVCDRGYKLGVYAPDGRLEKEIGEKVAAISAARDEKGEIVGFYARSSEGDKLTRYDAAGERVWQVDVPTGRFPVPPTEHQGKVYICSNRGLLSVLDAADGKLRWQFQATPGFFVMAPVTVADDGTAYVAGMDGMVTAVRSRQ